jgi:osmotically-inducible protein OsmY
MRHFNLNISTTLLASAALIQVVAMPLQASELDSRIEASAKSSYNFKTYLKDDKIKVTSTNGAVILTGSVAEEQHRALAQETIAELPGVKSVDNQLTMVGDQPAEKSDGWISMKVKTALTFHKNVSGTGTGVHTQEGVVTLSGIASSEAQKQLTGEYAKEVDGVKEVRNDLIVTKPAKPASTLGEKVDDASITAQIKSSLLFHKSTHALATKVTTKNGMVTLRGEAKNAAEKDLVTKLSEDINGVKRVNNQMTVLKA